MKIRYYLLLLGYYLLVVLPHEQVGRFLASIFLPGSRVRYNGIMLAILCIILTFAGIWTARKVASTDKLFFAIYALLSILFISICINILFVLNVEAIHFIQYAVFAIICFQITRSYWRTMYWSVIAGAADELYQYLCLAPLKSEYYDFNDIVINAVGAGLGLVLIRVVNPEVYAFKISSCLQSFESMTVVAISAFVILGLTMGFLSYGPDSEAAFCFFKVENIQFWHIVNPDIKFHVVKPIEGLVAIIFLITAYSFLERGSRRIDHNENTVKIRV